MAEESVQPQQMENWRIVDADRCIAHYGDAAAKNSFVKPFMPGYSAPLLVLNRDEINQAEHIEAAVDHAVAHRAAAVHAQLLRSGDDDRDALIGRLFGTASPRGLRKNDTVNTLEETYASDLPPEAKLDQLRSAWIKTLDAQYTVSSKADTSLSERFITSRAKLQTTLETLPRDEQAALKALGVDYYLSEDHTQEISGSNNTACSRYATRTVLLDNVLAGDRETVWEESYHILINHTLSPAARPANEDVIAWTKEHPERFDELKSTRMQYTPNARYYDRIVRGEIDIKDTDELMVDCYRVAKARAEERGVSMWNHEIAAGMNKDFSWLWGLVEHVHADIAAYAYVHSARNENPEAHALLQNLEQVRGAGSIEILQKNIGK